MTQKMTLHEDMMPTEVNKFPLIGDVSLRLEARDDRSACVVSLDMGIEEIPVGSKTLSVSFNKAYLKVVCNGYRIIKSSRHGIPQQSVPTTRQKTRVETRQDLGAEGFLKLNATASSTKLPQASFEGGAEASAGLSKNKTVTEDSEGVLDFQLVKARGGDTWEVAGPDKDRALDGNYLNDDPLFEFEPDPDYQGNKRSIEVFLIVKQSDMNLNNFPSKGKMGFGGSGIENNKNKVAKVFMGKCLAKVYSLDAPYEGKFAISYLETEVPHDDFFE